MKAFFRLPSSNSSKKKTSRSGKVSTRGSTCGSRTSTSEGSASKKKSKDIKRTTAPPVPTDDFQDMVISTTPHGYGSSCASSSASSVSTEGHRSVKLSDPDLPLIIEYMRCMNAHDLKGMAKVCEKDIAFDFIGTVFNWSSWETEVDKLFQAFPDFHFEWDSIVYGENGSLVMEEFQASGTHTGCAYGFGPYPKIQPTGIKVKNDPEVLNFFFKNGKISKIVFSTGGRLTGPSGIYHQLGGFALLQEDAAVKPKPVKMNDPNLPLVLEYMRCMNAHDLKGMSKVCEDEISFDFIDTQFNWELWESEVDKLFKAFPDFHFEWDEIVQGTDGVLVVQEFQASGTHTGCPYGFGPYPEIESTGTKVENDPEILHFYFKDGKICKVLFVTQGRLTGPPGVYTQLGGFALQ